jgi:hypothetical protein
VTVLAALSIVASTSIAMSWDNVGMRYRETVWGEIARTFTQGGGSRLMFFAAKSIYAWNRNRLIGVGIVCLCVAAAALIAAPRLRRDRAPTRPAETSSPESA